MGQAKRRGTFEERLKQAMEKKIVTAQVVVKQPEQVVVSPTRRTPTRHRNHSMILMAALMGALDVHNSKPKL